MMFSFRNLSIKNKIIAINISNCCLVVFFASLVFVGSATLIYRQAAIDELSSIANMVGHNSRAALLFKDREGAGVILSALQSKSNITFAEIIGKDGTVLGLLRVSGRHAERLHDEHVGDLRPMALEFDEQWSFVKKSKNVVWIMNGVKLVTCGIIRPWPLTASWWCRYG